MNESGRHAVSVGYRISQPLWQIENHSASLCCVTHLGSWQENAQIKEFPLWGNCSLCGWQIAVELNGARWLLIHKRFWRSHRRFSEMFRTICPLRLKNTCNKRFEFLCRSVININRHSFLYILYFVRTISSAPCMCLKYLFDPNKNVDVCFLCFEVDVMHSAVTCKPQRQKREMRVCWEAVGSSQSSQSLGLAEDLGLGSRATGDRLLDV